MEFMLNQYYQQLAMFIIVNAILGISIYLTLSTGQLSLGNAGFMSIGAYTSALLTVKAGLPMFVSVPIGGLAACCIAVLIGLPTTRLQGIYLAIATLGFGEVVRVIILNLKITNGALGLSGIPSLGVSIGKIFGGLGYGNGLFGLSLQQIGNFSVIFLLLMILILLVLFTLRLGNSRIGRAFSAIKADEHAAEVSGIDTTKYKLLAFCLGAMVAGLAGGLSAHLTFYIGPKDFAYHRAVEILLFAVLGGSNVVWGPLLGAVILTSLPEMLRSAAVYREMIYGTILVVMMAFRPQGLLDSHTLNNWKQRLFPGGTRESAELTGRSGDDVVA
ncbi:MAG: branched-chain amino acid ABC transporter permease [Veillonellaceae bacterium]|jgi:branched-chain amino acid transport system permease protein|nr:branched-chain amino acid ABC transporter permease [Veillonellaceae bacterium]